MLTCAVFVVLIHRNMDQLTYDSDDIIWCNMNPNDSQWENDEQLFLKLTSHIEELELEVEIQWNNHLEMMRRATIHIRELERQLAIAVSRKEREFEFINLAKLKYVLLATHVLENLEKKKEEEEKEYSENSYCRR